MRPLAILALVIAAIAALFIALASLLGGANEPQGGGPDLAAAATTEEVEEAEGRTTALVGGGGGERQAEIVRPDPEPDRVTAPADSLPAGEFVLKGKVYDPDGNPMPSVRLMLIRRALPPELLALQLLAQPAPGADDAPAGDDAAEYDTSLSDGAYEFPRLERGTDYRVVAEDPEGRFARFHSETLRIGDEPVTEFDVRFTQGIVCQGYVTDPSGAAIADARLVLVDQMEQIFSQMNRPVGQLASTRLEAKTDEQGFFRIPNVTPGRRSLTASASGFGSETRINLVFGDGNAMVEEDFRLQFGLCITGVVLGPDRQPIAGAEVVAQSIGTVSMSRSSTTSAEDGRFELCDLAPGEFAVYARKPGYVEERDQNIVEAGVQNVAIELYELGKVTGRVLDCDANAPLGVPFRVNARAVMPNSAMYGRPIASRRFEVEESPDGAFTLEGLPDGQYVVQAFAAGIAPSFSDPFQVTQGMVTEGVVVCAAEGGNVVGRVVDRSTGEPVPNAVVQTHDEGHFDGLGILGVLGSGSRMTADQSARTDGDGRFELVALNAEVYQFRISHPDFSTRILDGMNVQEGRDLDLGNVQLSRGATVTGTVYGEDGNPLGGATIQLSGEGGTAVTRMFSGRANAQGRFRIDHIAEGSYRMTASRPAGASVGDPFAALLDSENSKVSITLREGQTLQQDLSLAAN